MRLLRRFLAAAVAGCALSAQASVGLLQLPPPAAGDGPVTVYYPTAAPEQPVRRGPFSLQLATDAPPARGNGRLVVISHGSGSNPWVQADLARALVEAGFVVAMPEHQGDNARDPAQPGPPSWLRRPLEVSRAIDAVQRDGRLAPQLAFDRVGMYGMSAGGHTALTLAGGRWSPARYRDHCVAHLADDFAACVGYAARLHGDLWDGPKKAVAEGVIRHRYTDDAWASHTDPRIAAVVAGVPFAADFEAASLARPVVPLGLVTAGRDTWLAPRLHSGPILRACLPRCELLADMPDGGHAALLSPPPPLDAMGDVARDLLADPPGFDRGREVPAVHARIVAFFRHHLLSLE